MKIHIPAWLTDTLKDFRKELIRFAIVSGGLGAVILAYVTGFGTHLFALISSHITIIAVLILFALFYLLGRRNEKSRTLTKTKNKVSIVQQELFQYGPLKWDMTIYSNGHFKVAPLPYCASHDMRLVKQGPLYFCPRFGTECNSQISYKNIPIAKAEVESHIESQLRKRHTQQVNQGDG